MEETKSLGTNRKALFNYEVVETLECGIELRGTEVKSIRSGKFSFTDSYARIKDGELWLQALHISPYAFGNMNNHEPERERRLLVHKDEIKRLRRRVEERGFTLIPLKFYLKRGLVKVQVGVCRGKKLHDKREAIKRKDQKREEAREFRESLR
jgi:SsrA-binding protein